MITGKTNQHHITVKGGTADTPIQVGLQGGDMDLSGKIRPLFIYLGTTAWLEFQPWPPLMSTVLP
ncbi:MAG: hypothetical protein HFE75_01510 [Firmicutes bacterium]|nr:hypothetical protein [Bacillota bacterium]